MEGEERHSGAGPLPASHQLSIVTPHIPAIFPTASQQRFTQVFPYLLLFSALEASLGLGLRMRLAAQARGLPPIKNEKCFVSVLNLGGPEASEELLTSLCEERHMMSSEMFPSLKEIEK